MLCFPVFPELCLWLRVQKWCFIRVLTFHTFSANLSMGVHKGQQKQAIHCINLYIIGATDHVAHIHNVDKRTSHKKMWQSVYYLYLLLEQVICWPSRFLWPASLFCTTHQHWPKDSTVTVWAKVANGIPFHQWIYWTGLFQHEHAMDG